MRVLWYPKERSAPHEWEDAALVDEANATAVVLDGASNSFDARGWARFLAWEFLDTPPPSWDDDGMFAWMQHAQAKWAHHAPERRAARHLPEMLDPLDREAPSGATIAAARLSVQTGRWQGVCVGDSCIFQVRGAEIVTAHPVTDADAFGSTPTLVTTELLERRPKWVPSTVENELRPGDDLFLATDAVAAWILTAEVDWDLLRAASLSEFQQMVEAERSARRMAVDDATLVHCSWAP